MQLQGFDDFVHALPPLCLQLSRTWPFNYEYITVLLYIFLNHSHDLRSSITEIVDDKDCRPDIITEREREREIMGRAPCCSKVGLHRGPWTPREDTLLTKYIQAHGEGHWRSLPKKAGKCTIFFYNLIIYIIPLHNSNLDDVWPFVFLFYLNLYVIFPPKHKQLNNTHQVPFPFLCCPFLWEVGTWG